MFRVQGFVPGFAQAFGAGGSVFIICLKVAATQAYRFGHATGLNQKASAYPLHSHGDLTIVGLGFSV